MSSDDTEVFDPAEGCPWRSPREILARYGYSPLPPDQLDDLQLPGRLWELLYAAAARRFFFCFTNHLDDRSLYVLLSEEWLDEPTADIPLEEETNTTTFVSEFNAGGLTHDQIWLRYYADDSDRRWLRETEPDSVFPPHTDPPHDRDRFLPTPPVPPETHPGWLSDADGSPEDAEPDPLGLGDVDREIEEAKGESMPDSPPFDPTAATLEGHVHAADPENWTPPAQQLAAQDVPLLPPAEITDEMLVPILWALLHNLALRGFYVLHTDHLSDLELYAELWIQGLRDPAHLPGRNPRGAWFHDVLGSCGEDETRIWLRYYANDEERAEHACDWPQDLVPLKESRPFNRDWRLPQGPFR